MGIGKKQVEVNARMLIDVLYPYFNARKLDEIMPFFAADADWPNGMTGGRELGHEAIRTYWTNQWAMINSQVTPISYRVDGESVSLEVHQLIKDMAGEVLSDSVVFHDYEFAARKIAKMDISESVSDTARSLYIACGTS